MASIRVTKAKLYRTCWNRLDSAGYCGSDSSRDLAMTFSQTDSGFLPSNVNDITKVGILALQKLSFQIADSTSAHLSSNVLGRASSTERNHAAEQTVSTALSTVRTFLRWVRVWVSLGKSDLLTKSLRLCRRRRRLHPLPAQLRSYKMSTAQLVGVTKPRSTNGVGLSLAEYGRL